MKEICEKLFCFWKKCFKYTNKKISQIEYTKMLPQTHQKKKANTEFFSPKEKDKSTLKFKETDLITTKLAIIEEEIVLPNKYLNNIESDSNFKFEFAKKNIISFLEKEINDNTNYKPLINKDGLGYVEENLLNAIQWYYEAVKSETNYDEDVAEVTLDSNEYYEHHSYFKLGIKIINLISSLESLLIFNDKNSMDTKKERFNLIINFNNDPIYDYSKDLQELYDIRNDIAHSNKSCNLLKFNINKNTSLLNIFIMSFIEIKLAFDNDSEKSLDSREDLVNFYNGKNRLKGQFDYIKTL